MKPSLQNYITALRKILLIVATCLTITLPAIAADLQRGLNALNRGDYATALEEILPLAEAGNANAQFILGLMHSKGHGTPQDYQQAFTWFEKAAEQGFVGAQWQLGEMYREGKGTPQDYQQARMWFQKLAEEGDNAAQSSLGWLHYFGEGTPQDFVLAYMWFNIAAANGDELAIKNRDSLLKTMTPTQIAEGQRLSRECVAKNLKNCP